MFRRIAVLLMFALVGNVKAQDVSENIQVELFADFVAIELNNDAFNMNVSIAGPDDYNFTKEYRGSETAFFDLTDARGDAMADGLYKYEIKPVPVKRFSRAESSAMPDRNTLHGKSAAKVSPVSGSFRVVDGQVVDAGLFEGGEG